MPLVKWSIALVLALLPVCPVVAQLSFDIAFLREDGILLPIMRVEQGMWSALNGTESLPEHWYFHAPSGALWRIDLGPASRDVPGGYLTGFTVRPNLPGKPPKTGIAVSPRRPLVRIDAVPAGTLPARFMLHAPFQIETVYRSHSEVEDATLYMVSASNKRAQGDCKRLDSWYIAYDGRSSQMDRLETACGEESIPLGMLPLDGLRHAYVVAATAAGDYRIFEIRERRIHIIPVPKL